jgi:hypothetical protein
LCVFEKNALDSLTLHIAGNPLRSIWKLVGIDPMSC